MQKQRCLSASLRRWLEETNTELLRHKSTYSVSECHISKQASHKCLCRCCCFLLVPVNVLKNHCASCNDTKIHTKRHSHIPMLELRLISFFRVDLFRNFRNIFESDILITVFQQLEDIFSIVCTNLRPYLNIDLLNLQNVDVSTKRSKSGHSCTKTYS